MTDILQALQEVPELSQVPKEQLQWLLDHSELLTYEAGALLFKSGEIPQNMFIILGGRIRIWFEQLGKAREIGSLEKGDISGMLPYSRLKMTKGNGLVMDQALVLATNKELFPEMIRTQYDLVEALVHSMANRIRNFTTLQVQNEKLLSLGKLSAGLAHELNNPSSAVVRVAKDLHQHLSYLPENFKRVIAIRLENEQVDRVNERLQERIQQGVSSLSLLQRKRLEENMEEWLEDHEVSLSDDALEVLIDYGFTEDDLDFILDHVNTREFTPVMNWVGNVLTTEKYVKEIKDASQRISDLVTSIKSYSHMDQDQDRHKVDIREGIHSTRRMLDHKFRRAKVDFETEFTEPFPKIHANPGQLNQVWTNLLDNALDALEPTGGIITFKGKQDGACLYVEIVDNGPGVPEEVQNLIFDPFFTTKEMGKGTGLGLDVVRRIVLSHKGDIKLESRPGRTVFTLSFPLQ
ncbi:MAG: cyclic nucleotide-binding domain-containing protein [Chloroflexi bacterium AL-W]|nr:cyclic nucleotide-binding domain-containing protein [Chloroflexi bacterium AL-W]